MLNQYLSQIDQIQESAFKILIILVLFLVARMLIVRATNKIVSKQKTAKARTLINATSSAMTITLVIIVLLTILSEIGVDILPLLASAGIAGFAIGFASQSLLKDIINGLFIITGDIFLEGDIIKIANIEGKVEKISLRSITLRDIDGVLHNIPNSMINTIANYTKEWARANITIGISSEHEIDKVMEIINQELTNMRTEESWKKYLIDSPRLEITDIQASKTVLRIMIKTKGNKQWDLERELWYRLKKLFEQEGLKFA